MKKNFHWSYQILDADTKMESIGMQTLADIDGDGVQEIITGGYCGLFWYKYPSGKKHFIDKRYMSVGLTCYDVNKDGYLDIVAAVDKPYGTVWYENPKDLSNPWKCHVIEVDRVGYTHNLVFADINNDGKDELVANSIPLDITVDKLAEGLGLYSYTIPDDPTRHLWPKKKISSEVLSEGLLVADINRDGRLDLVAGPCWYEPPEDLDKGEWKRHVIAKRFRERCSVSVGDVNRDGKLDVLIAECEYPDGRWALFENMNNGKSWKKRMFRDRLPYFTHSTLLVDYDGDGDLDIVIAEMVQGGWNAPRNIRAKMLLYENLDGVGGRWRRHLINEGIGTHDAKVVDIDGDGELEIVGKTWKDPTIVQVWDMQPGPEPFRMRHSFIDENKEASAIDILTADVDGDGLEDVICGNVWYHNPDWRKYSLPLIGQSIAVWDINKDGKLDIIGVKGKTYPFSSELYWLEAPSDLFEGEWAPHHIGKGDGDWPHGAAIGPVLPNGKTALILGYHSAEHAGDLPQYFEMPTDPKQPWTKRELADIRYGEEIVLADINRDERLDIVAGPYWLESEGNMWLVHKIANPDDYNNIDRVRAVDMNRNGRIDVVVCEESIDWNAKTVGLGRVTWFEAPPDPTRDKWVEHVVSVMRCPHSLDVADLDGDGQVEIIVGEHDPFMAYDPNAFCKLAVYKRVDLAGTVWEEHVLDTRYEHHDGAHVIKLYRKGRLGIVSHGWSEEKYVHLWK